MTYRSKQRHGIETKKKKKANQPNPHKQANQPKQRIGTQNNGLFMGERSSKGGPWTLRRAKRPT